jgi:hypothetical protein
MFCLMDVSGSMDEARKDLAKRFFILLYLFLTRHYEKIDLVFIRHHTQAQEVTSRTSSTPRETGGTVVSSALVLMEEIIRARYPSRRVEHLRRAGQRRRQLAPRQRPLPRAAGEKILPLVPLLCLRAGGRGRAEPVGGIRQHRAPPPSFAMRKAVAPTRSTRCSATCSRRKGRRPHEVAARTPTHGVLPTACAACSSGPAAAAGARATGRSS